MAANGARSRTPANDSWLASFKYRLDNDPELKLQAGKVAAALGRPIGVVRGAGNTVKGLYDTAVFLQRLSDPMDVLRSPPGQSAIQQLSRATGQAVDYTKQAVREPQRVVQDAKKTVHRANVSLNPAASPQAPTFGGEIKRNFDIGLNQGDALFQVGSMFVPAGAVVKVARIGALPKAALEAKYLAQGFNAKQAAYLAEPYVGMGHHFYPRSGAPAKYFGFNVPKPLQDFRLVPEVSNSPFNVLRPKGISRGEMYELHYKVDPKYTNSNLPRRVGGGQWHGTNLGLTKSDSLGRLWHGSPAPLHGLGSVPIRLAAEGGA